MQYADSILDLVGHTPLVRITRVVRDLGPLERQPLLLAKMEMLNPGGSVKDRIGLPMIEAAERAGLLKPGGTIIEPTSGNTGTGLAIAARIKGYRVIAVMPDKMSREKIDLLRAYGAEVVVTPTDVDPESPQSYYRVADRLTQEIPGAFQPNQYANPANPQTHYESTGPELWRGLQGRIDAFVWASGTGGSVSGVGRYFKEQNPDVGGFAVEPARSAVINGHERGQHKFQGMGPGFIPGNLDVALLDGAYMAWEEDAFPLVRRLAREEGVFVGMSSGATIWAALEKARELGPDKVVVCIAADSGARYMSTELFAD